MQADRQTYRLIATLCTPPGGWINKSFRYEACYNTICYDTLHLCAPKSWRIASLICHREANKNKTRNVGQCDGCPAEHRWHVLAALLPCSNAAKTWNLLKLAGVPQTTGPIWAVSGPMFTILWGHLKDILLLNKFFPIVNTCLGCEDIARQSCVMVPRWRFLGFFLGPAFTASHV